VLSASTDNRTFLRFRNGDPLGGWSAGTVTRGAAAVAVSANGTARPQRQLVMQLQ
jgi:hypothetical protein